MLAKREIGKLWDDIEKPPYKILFNAGVSGPAIWRLVQVVRQVDEVLAALRSRLEGRERLLCVHGNRFITHVALARLKGDFFDVRRPFTTEEKKAIGETVLRVIADVHNALSDMFPEAYLASLFKNARKCEALKVRSSRS